MDAFAESAKLRLQPDLSHLLCWVEEYFQLIGHHLGSMCTPPHCVHALVLCLQHVYYSSHHSALMLKS